MNCDGFTPAEPIRLRHRLALADLKIRWDSDGTDTPQDDIILGIVPILRQFVIDQIESAAYDFGISVKMIGDDHPRLRPVCHWLSARFRKFGLGV
jgi:hypothetical protein